MTKYKRLAALPLAAFIAASLAATPASALTNNQTCAQAQKDFANNGRVTTRTRAGTTLPIYGGIPYLIRKNLVCGPTGAVYKQYVITSDKSRCPVSQRCV